MELKITAAQLDRLHGWLVQEDGLERFAFLRCSPSGDALVVEAVDPVPDEECAVQRDTGVGLDLGAELDRLNDCFAAGQVPVLVHSHPFSALPGFSGQDRRMFREYRGWLGPQHPDRTLAFAVLGRHGMETTAFERLGEDERSTLPVEVVGDWRLDTHVDVPEPDRDLPAVDDGRYDRSIRALSAEGQARIAATTVGIVGVGGLGSMLAEQLARLGVGEFVLVDPDAVERSNLPRIYGAADHHVGRPKVDVVERNLWRVNPEASVETRRARAQEVAEEALLGCEVLVGAVDRVNARSFLNEFAVRHLKYFLDAGVVIEAGTDGGGDPVVEDELGVAQLVVPGVNACLSCLGRHDPERARLERLSEEQVAEEVDRGYVDGDVLAPQPAVTPLNGVIASQASRLVAKLATGYDAPPDLVHYRGLADEVTSMRTRPSEGCIVCGADGVLGRGERTPDLALVGGEYDDGDAALAGPAAASDGPDGRADRPARATGAEAASPGDDSAPTDGREAPDRPLPAADGPERDGDGPTATDDGSPDGGEDSGAKSRPAGRSTREGDAFGADGSHRRSADRDRDARDDDRRRPTPMELVKRWWWWP